MCWRDRVWEDFTEVPQELVYSSLSAFRIAGVSLAPSTLVSMHLQATINILPFGIINRCTYNSELSVPNKNRIQGREENALMTWFCAQPTMSNATVYSFVASQMVLLLLEFCFCSGELFYLWRERIYRWWMPLKCRAGYASHAAVDCTVKSLLTRVTKRVNIFRGKLKKTWVCCCFSAL